jgi:hypothetical protein
VSKTEKADTLDELFKAIPRGWIVGRPPFDASASKWRLFAYERRSSDGPGRLLTAEAATEQEAVRHMTRKLRTTAASRRPPRHARRR